MAVTGLDDGTKIQKDKNSNSSSSRSEIKEYDELYPSGRYSEFRPLRLPHKNHQLKSNDKTSKPHFPVPAQSYLAPAYNLPSALKSFVPPYIPKKSPSYDRPSSVYPTAYYTETPFYGYTTPSYPSPTFSPSPYFPSDNIDSAYHPTYRPKYPSIFYQDLKKEPGSYNHVSEEPVNTDDDFPKFDDFLRQSLNFQNFRP